MDVTTSGTTTLRRTRKTGRFARVAPAAAASAMLLLATACGAGADVGASKVDVKCDIDQPKEATTVNVLAYNSTATDPFTNVLTGNCASKTLTVNHPPTDLTGQKQRAIQSLSGSDASYDIVEQFGTVYPLYAERGWTAPLDDLIAKEGSRYDIEGIDPNLMKAHQYDGKQFGLPTYWSVQHLVYRKDVFEKLGLKPPTTFAEMRETAKAIQDANVVKAPLAIPMAPANDIQGLFGQALRSQGGDYFVEGKAEPALNGPEGVKAVEEIQSLLPYMSPEVLSYSSPEVTTQLQTGQAVMGLLVSGRLGPLVDEKSSPYAKDFGFATPPALEKGGKPLSFLSVDGFALAENSKVDQKLLFQMIGVATGEAAGKSVLPDALPSRLDLLEGSTIPFAANAQETLTKVKPTPLTQVPYMADVYSVIGAPIGDAINGKSDPQTALDQAQEVAVDAIDTAGFSEK